VQPLWHAHGQSFYWTAQYAKCEIEYFAPAQLRSVVKYAPTFTTSVPHVLKLLKNFNFSTLRFLAVAGHPMSADLYHELKNKFQIPIIEAFGMTESISHCFTNPLYGEQRVGTIGLPNGVDARIQDQQLYIRGPSLCNTGWINTGDLADQDEKGYYRILGRAIDQINVKGIKLNPTSLEFQLKNKVSELGDCVVFGVDSVNCVFTGSAKQNQIQEFFSSLGTKCRAKHIIKLDKIPLTNSGKISRIFLNELLQQEKLK
jgi:acyl-coenzyme A synthetase/AMP-(fatty) acid ligase